MNIRRYIAGSLWAGAIVTLVLLVAAALWGLLTAAGDHAGGQGAKGVTLVALTFWVLNFIALVVLVALAQIGVGGEHDEELREGGRE